MSDNSSGKNSLLKTFVKERDLFAGIIVTAIALLVTAILPLCLDLNPLLDKIIDGLRWLALSLALLSIIGIITKISTLKEQVKNVEEHLAEAQIVKKFSALKEQVQNVEEHLLRERIIEIALPNQYLTKLQELMAGANRGVIRLMYFVEKPKTDASSEQYWHSFISLLKDKSKDPVMFKRIATISTRAKLESILRNNRLLFEACKDPKNPFDCSKINYSLAYYPNAEIRPPQVDIDNETVFLFSPYSDAGKAATRVWTKNPTLVENFTEYYDGLWSFLQAQHNVVFDFSDRNKPEYKNEEVVKFMQIARTLKISEEETFFNEHIKSCTSLEFSHLKKMMGPSHG